MRPRLWFWCHASLTAEWRKLILQPSAFLLIFLIFLYCSSWASVTSICPSRSVSLQRLRACTLRKTKQDLACCSVKGQKSDVLSVKAFDVFPSVIIDSNWGEHPLRRSLKVKGDPIVDFMIEQSPFPHHSLLIIHFPVASLFPPAHSARSCLDRQNDLRFILRMRALL